MIRSGKKTSAQIKTVADGVAVGAEDPWEVRPGGMLVQKRCTNTKSASDMSTLVPSIRVRVMYGAACHEICLSSQSTFGEVKRMVAERTGLHPQDQKILYKDKERESAAYLDVSGVKDRSKMVLMADPIAHAKRVIEMRRAKTMEKASKLVSSVGSDVDRLASKVSALEAIVLKGKKIADEDVANLIEQLMSQLLKLDGIVAEGDVKLQRGLQVRRVQKYVETLDMVRIKNAKITTDSLMPSRQQAPQSVVMTTDWEMFDSVFSPSSASAATSTTTATSTTSSAAGPRSEWELF